MPVSFYMDHNVKGPVTVGLRSRGVDVLTAEEDGNKRMSDPSLLDRATELQRVFFTNDDDFLAEGANRQREGIHFPGIVYAHQIRVSVGRSVQDLETIAKTRQLEDVANTVTYLPLRSIIYGQEDAQ